MGARPSGPVASAHALRLLTKKKMQDSGVEKILTVQGCDEADANSESGAAWCRIDDMDEIWSQSETCEIPLPVTLPNELPLGRLEWRNFERLILKLVMRREGTSSVRLYGRPGQRQHGIDIACLPPDGEDSLYQTKRVGSFNATELEEAIRGYADGMRPIDARRFTVVVACDAQDAETTNRLHECQAQYPELELELWDSHTLSELLRDQPDIVEQFFGKHTREAFCVEGEPPSGTSHSDIGNLPDFVLRGPVRQLGLSAVLRKAETDEQENPQSAAVAYESIADNLRDAAFEGHADLYRLKQADALEQAGQHVDASRIRLAVAWSLIDSADLWTAQAAARKVADAADQLPQPLRRSLDALCSALELRLVSNPEDTLGTGTSLIDLLEAVEALQAVDPHRHLALLALSEEAVAARRLDLVRHVADVIQEAIADKALDDDEPLIAARMRVCIADAAGEWHSLWQHARTHYPPEIAALVSARWGRYAALQGSVDLAVERYRSAIEAATAAQNYGDASAWLYALRTARISNEDRPGAYVNEIHRIAETLRAHGDASVFPYGGTRTRALANLVSGFPPDAHEAIRRHLRHSTVSASLAEEMEAHKLLGQFLGSVARTSDAIRHYVLAGAGKEAAQLAERWPNMPLNLDTDNARGACWERTAGYVVAAEFEDWLPDDLRDGWAVSALAEVLADCPHDEDRWSQLKRAASSVLASTAAGLNERHAESFLDHISSRLDNQQDNRVEFVDKCVTVLYEIARQHHELAPRAVTVIMELLLSAPYRHLNDWDGGADVLPCHKDIVRDKLTALAQAGDLTACIVMAAAECIDEPVLEMARSRLDQAAAPPDRQPGKVYIGTGRHIDACLIRHLEPENTRRFVAAMTALAVDAAEPLPNRQEALEAATDLVSELPESERTKFYATALECAAGMHDRQGDIPVPMGPTDPLHRFRASFGPETLGPAALEFAAACATTQEQFEQVRWAALEMLNASDKYTACTAANAAALLPVRILTDDVDALRLRVDDWARWLAAVTWARLDDADETAGRRLAMDSSHIVRAGLASALRDIPAHEAPRQRLLGDVRRTIRDTVSRTAKLG